MRSDKSVNFFETQFQQQVREQDFALNPFEMLTLDYLTGNVLDLGCGLGNLSLEAARRGHSVMAIDASPTAIKRIQEDAAREGLAVQAVVADIDASTIQQDFDTILAIGIIPFFCHELSLKLLKSIQDHVRPGGRLIVNALLEGTTYLELFETGKFHFYRPQELQDQFLDWEILESCRHQFEAPGNTLKSMITIIAEKPRKA